jgi:membrane associated rhomboid family serine protease
MILLVVSSTERTIGSLNTFSIFSLSHLTSMLAFAIGVGALQWTYLSRTVSTLYDFHDVGPSAGYYGCLGALLVASKWRHKRSIAVGILALLTLRIIISVRTMPESHAALSADIVHLIAILAGIMIQELRLSLSPLSRSAARE